MYARVIGIALCLFVGCGDNIRPGSNDAGLGDDFQSVPEPLDDVLEEVPGPVDAGVGGGSDCDKHVELNGHEHKCQH